MKMKRLSVWIVVVLVAVVVAACAPRAATKLAQGVQREAAAAGQAPYGGPAGGDTASGTKQDENRMIVRTADLSLLVKDTENSAEEIKGIVTELGGYVVDIRLWRDGEQLRGTVTVRVPADSLDQALSRFKGLAVQVQRESGSSIDVTEEYSDLGAQLRNLEATEQELLELLRTVREKTGKAEDILAVHRELTSIRGQIEQLKGRMQYLERTSEMSSVTIELVPDILAQPIARPGWRPSQTIAGALRALLQTLRLVVDAVIWVVLYLLPLAVVVLIPVALLWFLWRRSKKSKPLKS